MGARENAWERVLELVESLGRADAAARPEPQLPADEALLAVARGVIADLPNDALTDLRAAYNDGRRPDRIDLDRVVEELNALGVPAFVENIGDGGATLFAGQHGPIALGGEYGGYPVTAGPGQFEGPGITVPVAYRPTFSVGIDDNAPPPSPNLPDFATPAQYARIIAAAIQEARTRAERVAAAQEAARDAFWATLAERFPEIESGDFGPDDTIALEQATNQAVRSWLHYNALARTGVTATRPLADFEPRYVLIDNQQGSAFAVDENGVDLVCAEMFGGRPDWRNASLAAPVGLDDEQWAWCGRVRDGLKAVAEPNPFDQPEEVTTRQEHPHDYSDYSDVN